MYYARGHCESEEAAESEKYAHLVADALNKSGHGVFTKKHFSSDAKAMQECHICLDMTTGKLP